MKQTIAMTALAVQDLERSLAFYAAAFDWKPVFQNEAVAFFQMNGFFFSLATQELLENELEEKLQFGSNSFTIAHIVASEEEVDSIIRHANQNGARLLQEPVKRDWGGYSGYLADPDGHKWEIAWNPFWKVSPEGYVSLGE